MAGILSQSSRTIAFVISSSICVVWILGLMAGRSKKVRPIAFVIFSVIYFTFCILYLPNDNYNFDMKDDFVLPILPNERRDKNTTFNTTNRPSKKEILMFPPSQNENRNAKYSIVKEASMVSLPSRNESGCASYVNSDKWIFGKRLGNIDEDSFTNAFVNDMIVTSSIIESNDGLRGILNQTICMDNLRF